MKNFKLPQIPSYKTFNEASKATIEQDIILKCTALQILTDSEENILTDAICFYQALFAALKAINLSELTFEEAEELKKYLDEAFNFNFLTFNDITFDVVYRVSLIKKEFLEKGKVRTPRYLTYPPLKSIMDSKIFNRANTWTETVFYASFSENVAVRETKPTKGQNIIISTWKNKTEKPFVSYPITNSSINNVGVQKATKAFHETKKVNHPLFAKIMDLHLEFMASEFVKDRPVTNPYHLEYLFSAYFAGKILSPRIEGDTVPDHDLIIYPSVAWRHQHENIAMTKHSLDHKMKLIYAIEYEVEETYYGKDVAMDEMPAKLKFIRESYWFEDDLIIWEDD
jgi:hypothetical protein